MFSSQLAPRVINGEPVSMSPWAVMGSEMIDPFQRTRHSIARRADWQSRLSAYLVACAHKPFRYGELDCGLFVAGAIEAMTGVDVAAGLRGYSDRKTAFARIEAMCGRPSMEAIADHLAAAFGVHEVPVLCAQRGDVILLRRGRRASLGLVAMHGTDLLTPYRAGILRAPLSLAVRAWRI